jgi:hypothetical protein
MTRFFGAPISALVFLGAVLTVPAHADLMVSVTGGFTSFQGVVLGPAAGTQSFINGTSVCPDTGCGTSAGTANLTFQPPTPKNTVDFYNLQYIGGPPNTPNELQFTPAAPQQVHVAGPVTQYLLGTVTFENGIWSGDADFGFQLTTHSNDAALDGQTNDVIIRMRLTPNNFVNQTPDQNADFLELINPTTGQPIDNWLTGNPLQTLRVDEIQDSPTGSNIGSANLYGVIDDLFFTDFANPTGAAFLSSSHTLSPDSTSAVPEPSAVVLLCGALVGMAICVRRRNAIAICTERKNEHGIA